MSALAAMIAPTEPTSAVLPDLLALTSEALKAADLFAQAATASVASVVKRDGRVKAELLEQEQLAAHGLAWLITYVESLRQLHNWANRLNDEGQLGELESLILQAGFGEYVAQMTGGIPMSQGEIIRPQTLYIDDAAIDLFRNNQAVHDLRRMGNSIQAQKRIAELVKDGIITGQFGNNGLDETLSLVRDQFRRFATDKVIDEAPKWHDNDELIPIEIINELAEMGVFGLTIPEEYGGHGMGKIAMCIVSEELSRGYIGVGSLGTRSEIAAELILGGGTEEQKQKWLPKLAAAEVLPTAVFTEPNNGSDLGGLRTRAVKEGDVYKITGNKTWITHAARADIMTLLARTNPNEPDYKGLSMFIAEKPRGTVEEPFPANGMSGGEIRVLGYRGMKEYELGFDQFEVKAENLLGGEEGKGFKQLMITFESARIQTAARAIGVAQSALEYGLRYALERIQFNKALINFPRVYGKIAWMVVELMIARQLTYFAANEKDSHRRCDLEAGMAKLLAARIAWSCADNALQIHGGNGYACEYPISRVLCDSRILNVFEGAAEIQAQVIARRLLDGN